PELTSRMRRSIRPTRAGAASSFLVYRNSNGGECGFQFFALPFRHEMSGLGIPADVARQVFHPRCSENVQIKPENFIGHGEHSEKNGVSKRGFSPHKRWR